jgi:hypothetical protein
MLGLFVAFVIIVAAVISIADIIGSYAVMNDPKRLTIPFGILVLVSTIIPIVIKLWYPLVFKQKQAIIKEE